MNEANDLRARIAALEAESLDHYREGWDAGAASNKAVDKNVEAVREKMRRRADMGLTKYGVTTERTDLNFEQWATHAQEEAMDLAIYIERLKVEYRNAFGNQINALKADNRRLMSSCRTAWQKVERLEAEILEANLVIERLGTFASENSKPGKPKGESVKVGGTE